MHTSGVGSEESRSDDVLVAGGFRDCVKSRRRIYKSLMNFCKSLEVRRQKPAFSTFHTNSLTPGRAAEAIRRGATFASIRQIRFSPLPACGKDSLRDESPSPTIQELNPGPPSRHRSTMFLQRAPALKLFGRNHRPVHNTFNCSKETKPQARRADRN